MIHYKSIHYIKNIEPHKCSWVGSPSANSQSTFHKPKQSGWRPPMDITENAEQFNIEVEIPGMRSESLDVEVGSNYLVIRGEKKSLHARRQETQNYIEREYGAFETTIRLPVHINIGSVNSCYADGVLTIQAPKEEISEFHFIPITFNDNNSPRELRL